MLCVGMYYLVALRKNLRVLRDFVVKNIYSLRG